MLKIRLKRVGRKHDPSFRFVVTDSRRGPKSGNYVEMLGSFDHRKSPQVNAARVSYWIARGAQISATVHNIFVDQKLIEAPKRRPSRKPGPASVRAEKKQEVVAPESTASVEEPVSA